MRHTASTPSTNQSVLTSSMRSYFTHTDKNGGLEEFEHPEKQAITPPARWHLTQQAPRRIVGDAWFSRTLGCGEDSLSGQTPRGLNTAFGLARRTRHPKTCRHIEEEKSCAT